MLPRPNVAALEKLFTLRRRHLLSKPHGFHPEPVIGLMQIKRRGTPVVSYDGNGLTYPFESFAAGSMKGVDDSNVGRYCLEQNFVARLQCRRHSSFWPNGLECTHELEHEVFTRRLGNDRQAKRPPIILEQP